ncbi:MULTISPECIES: pyridoxamine 5'-phosphate oxidase family protein [Caulobacter]|jgi:predicted pyridoxine 5'-phosphate oxidase superfamily flavin-nucleotide-binding protein|uniref:Pyridoxamine 5'-phosphate oxidase-related, FMN binding protein n=1 Tax=Caulobacter vibrioides OR37 TaxID=1292034 RepID=R0EMU5_CAUVI|nr:MULTISPECIES: pyridoxamine 5'-phosphate oxidase family protein [Caulobacter]ENZ82412.1 pyridoxamine 5'-phosphate oxidase-related, FMN binding protein [Caulobacter vibrioides OR37]MBQ1560287.1 pyridoxamine 5'-phosphate oxidase family protein [Caulobacter sp.]
MSKYSFLDFASSPSVRAAQAEMGSDRMWTPGGVDRVFERFTAEEAAFIAERDSFYLASVSEQGWPYVQHRGGPPGFLKVIDDITLAFADYRGNRQYISVGNTDADDRVALILVDYPRRARLKILAHAERLALDFDPALTGRVTEGLGRAKPERIFRLRLAAFDWNCPQHITPRFTEAEIERALTPLRDRLEALEAENRRLRARLAQNED